MMKFVFLICIAGALMQQTLAFKVVSVHKGVLLPSAVAAPAAPAAPSVDPAALLQGVQSAIVSKLQEVQTLVAGLIQQKTALKQNALNSIQSSLAGIKSQVGSLAGNIHPSFVIRKQIYVGAPKPAPAAPDSTTSVDVDATTTSE